MTSAIDQNHAAEFERAWSDPANTAIDFPPVDVNQVLRERYVLDRDLVYTRRLLWDMEVRKAATPDLYIPSVVRPGSVSVWRSSPTVFTRASDQRLWLRPQTFGVVIEHVHLDEQRQSVYFIGTAEYRTPDSQTIRAGGEQPLFHVEHWVEGQEDRPVNRWRIVHLTPSPDQALLDHFTAMGRDPYLRDFIEVHLREVLGCTLTRKGG
jgi:hypothetical protein